MAVLHDSDDIAVCSNFCARVVPSLEVDSRYLAYVFGAAYILGYTQTAIKQTTGIQNLDSEAFLASQWAWPPLEEQRRIADFLDAETSRIDRVIHLSELTVANLKERQQVLIDDAIVGSSDRLIKLFWCLDLLRDGTHQPPQRADSGVRFLTARNVSGGFLRKTELDTFVSLEDATILERSLTLSPGDVLLSVKGTIGACAVTPEDFPRAVLDRNLALLRPGVGFSSEWLAYALKSRFVQEQMRVAVFAAAQPGLPLGAIRELRVPEVGLGDQIRVAGEIHAEADRLLALVGRIQQRTALLFERKSSLITAAVTGHFDVTTASGRNLTQGV
ncbi:hypothetical protein ACFXO9_34600 [Nocardia tengchongensis]|uniref:hypothetical protein n=1 Tax=Nocardia tengchongensis TaxID=2055889 RepID=UPI003694E4D2